jgi:hypothetical protein
MSQSNKYATSLQHFQACIITSFLVTPCLVTPYFCFVDPTVDEPTGVGLSLEEATGVGPLVDEAPDVSLLLDETTGVSPLVGEAPGVNPLLDEIVFVGALEHRKGLHIFCAAVTRLLTKWPADKMLPLRTVTFIGPDAEVLVGGEWPPLTPLVTPLVTPSYPPRDPL